MTDLREAIESTVATAAEEANVTTGLVVTEFVVVAHASGFDADGEQISQVIVIPDGGSESRILGLVEHARVRLHADILSDYGDD